MVTVNYIQTKTEKVLLNWIWTRNNLDFFFLYHLTPTKGGHFSHKIFLDQVRCEWVNHGDTDKDTDDEMSLSCIHCLNILYCCQYLKKNSSRRARKTRARFVWKIFWLQTEIQTWIVKKKHKKIDGGTQIIKNLFLKTFKYPKIWNWLKSI